MKSTLRFAMVWLANLLPIYFASAYYPMNYTLGNASISPFKAALFSGFLLTLAGRIAKDVLPKWGIKTNGRYKKFAVYWLVNSAAIWLISRFAFVTGIGISAYTWAIVLGFVGTLAQWLTRQIFKKLKMI